VSSVQVVQEYERAVIFRLGRIARGGAKGPGKNWTIYWLLYIRPLGSWKYCSYGQGTYKNKQHLELYTN